MLGWMDAQTIGFGSWDIITAHLLNSLNGVVARDACQMASGGVKEQTEATLSEYS